MFNVEVIEAIQSKYASFLPYLNERTRRVWAAMEAKAMGNGGVSVVAQVTGLSRNTIAAGLRDLQEHEGEGLGAASPQQIRRPGGGRKHIEIVDDTLLDDLESLVEPTTRGDPESPLRWTCKSVTNLAKQLQSMGHQVCAKTVYNLLRGMNYSLQSNRKTQEGAEHPDRDQQFQHIANTVTQFQQWHRPVISVDTKKKELIGNFKNNGQEWQPAKQPVQVNMHDFKDDELGKVIPYGVYDLSLNQGWVSVGIDHDTAEFAVESIRHWWNEMGQSLYPRSKHLLITADCGGSNGNRTRLWKLKLQEFADEVGLTIDVCHFPPGTSKWNKIEHRMFCHITQNWRGRPLTSRQVVVNLISHTTTPKGLEIHAMLDENTYDTGIEVTDEEFNTIALHKRRFHGDWNYQIKPRLAA
jgi:Rhodopirellula transposase DDE domain